MARPVASADGARATTAGTRLPGDAPWAALAAGDGRARRRLRLGRRDHRERPTRSTPDSVERQRASPARATAARPPPRAHTGAARQRPGADRSVPARGGSCRSTELRPHVRPAGVRDGRRTYRSCAGERRGQHEPHPAGRTQRRPAPGRGRPRGDGRPGAGQPDHAQRRRDAASGQITPRRGSEHAGTSTAISTTSAASGAVAAASALAASAPVVRQPADARQRQHQAAGDHAAPTGAWATGRAACAGQPGGRGRGRGGGQAARRASCRRERGCAPTGASSAETMGRLATAGWATSWPGSAELVRPVRLVRPRRSR